MDIKDKEIIVLDDDEDDIITSTEDITLPSKTKHTNISNIDLLTKAIGEANYNKIIDALCAVSNIETKAKALSVLFSINKEVQSRQVQTEAIQHSDLEVVTDCEGVPINDTLLIDEEVIQHSPCSQYSGFLPDSDDYFSEVIIDSQDNAESIITGEGELKLNRYSTSTIKFILKGDGRRKSIQDEE